MFPRLAFLALCCITTCVLADEPNGDDAENADSKSAAVDSATDASQGSEKVPFELTDQVREALSPLFSAIASAEVSRATVELSSESSMDGTLLESQASTYQVAAIKPDHFTVYFKDPEQRIRVYCDGESTAVAIGPEAYLRLPEPIGNQEAVTSLPIPLGPYPELVLALTMAGVDPAISFLGGMKSVEILDRDPFAENVPAVHLKGVQSDAVSWDLWIATDETPRPLRLTVDLTPILVASNQAQIPEGYAFQLRFDFLSWRVTGEVEKSLFTYTPPKDAKEYESFEQYYQSMAGVMAEHPLLGKESPAFEGVSLNGEKFNSTSFAGKVVVLDFWATWCTPCVASLPIMKQVTDQYAEKDVVFFALNTGEEAEQVKQFLKEREFELDVILDPDGKIASTFIADAIPLTIVIGKNGIIESAHIGFASEEMLQQRLKDELDVLAIGGKIASASESTDSDQAADTVSKPEASENE